MDENRIGELILGCAVRIHKSLGPGLLESAYEACLAHELDKSDLSYKRQVVLPVFYDSQRIDAGYRLDLLVADRLVIEVKAVEALFNVPRIKDGSCRLVNGL